MERLVTNSELIKALDDDTDFKINESPLKYINLNTVQYMQWPMSSSGQQYSNDNDDDENYITCVIT